MQISASEEAIEPIYSVKCGKQKIPEKFQNSSTKQLQMQKKLWIYIYIYIIKSRL